MKVVGLDREWWKTERLPGAAPNIRKRQAIPKAFMSPKALASRLGVSLDFVYDAIKAGDIEAQPLGRLLRISEDAVREYLERERAKGRA